MLTYSAFHELRGPLFLDWRSSAPHLMSQAPWLQFCHQRLNSLGRDGIFLPLFSGTVSGQQASLSRSTPCLFAKKIKPFRKKTTTSCSARKGRMFSVRSSKKHTVGLAARLWTARRWCPPGECHESETRTAWKNGEVANEQEKGERNITLWTWSKGTLFF